MITALDVANTFIERGKKENIDISPMKLQKLIFILYKNYLKDTRSKLFLDNFEVWQYGPVVPSVYNAFKQYRSNSIKNYYVSGDGNYSTVSFDNNDFKTNFERVWQKYKELDGVYLSKLTHQEDTAWSKAFSKKEPTLSDDDIYSEKEYVIGN